MSDQAAVAANQMTNILTELNRTATTPVLSNFVAMTHDGKTVNEPRMMADILADINERTGNWPRRIDSMLFVDDPEFGLSYFDKTGKSGVFGWLRRHHRVEWQEGGKFVSSAEIYAEMIRTATAYDGVERFPHWPSFPNLYYRCETPPLGDGSHLKWLLSQFRPETTVDAELIQAAFMTLFWGGAPGRRPAFVITSDQGRGVGKSTVVEIAGSLCGGHVSVSAGEDITELKKRLLSPNAREKRVCLIDNVKTHRLSWAELEAQITEPIISGRQLFVGEGRRPNLLTWFVTINGAAMARDMAQRSIIIKIVRGENDGAWFDRVNQYIAENRQAIVGDLLAALQKPVATPEDFRYSRWATWEQAVLCKLPNPAEAQRLILERQEGADSDQDEAEIIEEYVALQLRTLKYDPDRDAVRIQTRVLATWYNQATKDRLQTARVKSKIRQMINEKQLKRLEEDTSHHWGRGFIWTGKDHDPQTPILNTLEKKLEGWSWTS
jgi:hypothetical protein